MLSDVVSDLNKNFIRSTDLAEKRHGSADLHTPIHPPIYKYGFVFSSCEIISGTDTNECLQLPANTRKVLF